METGRMPACIALPLAGDRNTSVPNNTQDNNSLDNIQKQPFSLGNRCGHDKNIFRKPKFHGKSVRRPHVLEEAKRRIFRSIENNFLYPGFASLFYHQNSFGKGSGRHIRSERIEGTHGLTLPTLLQHLNLCRMACGYYDNKNQFRYVNYSFIENQTDQNSIRVKREMKLLQERGVIKVTTDREINHDGSWRTTNVKIEFTDKIFEMLELIPEFLKNREESMVKFYQKQSRLDKNKNREIYRKSTFSSPKISKPNKQNAKTKYAVKRPIYRQPKGRGQEIKALYTNLTEKGYTSLEAAEIIRTKFPPPT